jgi:hypothetical protein
VLVAFLPLPECSTSVDCFTRSRISRVETFKEWQGSFGAIGSPQSHCAQQFLLLG